MGISCQHFLISGNVQGVGYRIAAQRQALSLQLTGWVQNLPDGRVEILAQGQATKLNDFQHWLRQGPRFAEVTRVETDEIPVTQDLNDFVVRG